MEPKASCKPLLGGKSQACPLRGDWISFQIVDETGNGKPYAGLAYLLQDSAHQKYPGVLDGDGSAKVFNHYQGPVVLTLDAPYTGSDEYYKALSARKNIHCPSPNSKSMQNKPVLFEKMVCALRITLLKPRLINFFTLKFEIL
jgi:hypothetical protein